MSGPPPGDRNHEPLPGSAYTVGAVPNCNLPADLSKPGHYPVEAVCRCGEVIRCERVEQSGWSHTGRRAGGTI